MTIIKPIETYYNGYRFRSRLEARWAVCFDALNIEYEYEPEGFDLGDGYYYLPDFYLPEQKVWVEIKGKDLTNEEREKIERFCINKCDMANGGERFRLFKGEIPKEAFMIGNIPGIPCFIYKSPTEMKKVIEHFRGKCDKAPETGVLILGLWQNPTFTKDLVNKALLKARQARFEHGETPSFTKKVQEKNKSKITPEEFKEWLKGRMT